MAQLRYNQNGQLVDEYGRLVDETGAPIEQADPLDILGDGVGTIGGKVAGNYANKAIFGTQGGSILDIFGSGTGAQSVPWAAPMGPALPGAEAATLTNEAGFASKLPGLLGMGGGEAAAGSGAGLGTAATLGIGALGGAGLIDSMIKRRGKTRTPLQGAGSGAALGFLLGGPLGAAIGGAGGLLVGALNQYGNKPKTNKEEKKWKALLKSGAITEDQMPQWVKDGVNIRSAGYRDDLSSDFVGFDKDKSWANNKFAKSRSESDLKVDDIRGYASALGMSDADLQAALDAGAVREHHGTVDIDKSMFSGAGAKTEETKKDKSTKFVKNKGK